MPEAYLILVLEELFQSLPFVIRGFHSDNGSEYINRHVVQLLNKLLIEEQTKSRSRHNNDNAQAESKNGAIVRKHLGRPIRIVTSGVGGGSDFTARRVAEGISPDKAAAFARGYGVTMDPDYPHLPYGAG